MGAESGYGGLIAGSSHFATLCWIQKMGIATRGGLFGHGNEIDRFERPDLPSDGVRQCDGHHRPDERLGSAHRQGCDPTTARQ